MEEKNTGYPEETKQESRYTDKQRMAAKMALLILGGLLVILIVLLATGADIGRVALPVLAMMILAPVFLWLMVWSYTRMVVRSCEANDAALHRQFHIPDTVVFGSGDGPDGNSLGKALKEKGYRVHYLAGVPDEEGFRTLTDDHGIDPDKAVYIDATPAHVETAKRLGFQGIVYSSQTQAEQDLRALGVTR